MSRDVGLAEANPLGKIPALETPEAGVIFGSSVICQYLDAVGVRGEPLIPSGGAARWRCLTLEALADGMTEAAVLVRYEMALRPEALRWDDWIDGQMLKVVAGLDALETQFAGSGAGASNRSADLAQLAVGAALGYLDFRYGEIGWRTGRPVLADWFAFFSKLPVMQETKPA